VREFFFKIKEFFFASLTQYTKIAPGNLITASNIPDWAKSFFSLMAHLIPIIGSMVAIEPIKMPKQIKSMIGLAVMYLSVWGKDKLNHYPQVAGITVASSLFSDYTHAPNFIRRSLLAFLLTTADEIKKHELKDYSFANLNTIAKKLIPKILEMELKINSSVPVSEMIAQKTKNKFLQAGIQIIGISGIVTALTEILKKLGLSSMQNAKTSEALADSCPVCGEAHGVGECIASDIAPSLSMSSVNL
jgi:hypothetical protein